LSLIDATAAANSEGRGRSAARILERPQLDRLVAGFRQLIALWAAAGKSNRRTSCRRRAIVMMRNPSPQKKAETKMMMVHVSKLWHGKKRANTLPRARLKMRAQDPQGGRVA
jgi:hypothetical protein